MPNGDSKPTITKDITLGSMLSVVTTIIATVGLVYSTGSVVAELRGKDLLHDDRLARIEARLLRQESDHDRLARIEARLLRQESDHDLLIGIARDLKTVKERLGYRTDADPLRRSAPN